MPKKAKSPTWVSCPMPAPLRTATWSPRRTPGWHDAKGETSVPAPTETESGTSASGSITLTQRALGTPRPRMRAARSTMCPALCSGARNRSVSGRPFQLSNGPSTAASSTAVPAAITSSRKPWSRSGPPRAAWFRID